MITTAYTFIATTDEKTRCDLCGKDELKLTVVLKDNKTEEYVFFGSQCAAKAMGWKVKDVVKSAKIAQKEYKKEAVTFYRNRANIILVNKEVEDCNKKGLSFRDRPFKKWQELEKKRPKRIHIKNIPM